MSTNTAVVTAPESIASAKAARAAAESEAVSSEIGWYTTVCPTAPSTSFIAQTRACTSGGWLSPATTSAPRSVCPAVSSSVFARTRSRTISRTRSAVKSGTPPSGAAPSGISNAARASRSCCEPWAGCWASSSRATATAKAVIRDGLIRRRWSASEPVLLGMLSAT